MLLLVLGIMAHTLFAQVVVLNYMKVPAGGNESYVSVENQWKKVHQNLVNEGKKLAWNLYYVHNSGTESDYNFVTADIYKDIPSAIESFSYDALKEIWGDKTDDILKKTMDSRELIHSETVGLAMGIPSVNKEKYLLVSFMKADDPDCVFQYGEDRFPTDAPGRHRQWSNGRVECMATLPSR